MANVFTIDRFDPVDPQAVVQGWVTPFQAGGASVINAVRFNVNRQVQIVAIGCYVGCEANRTGTQIVKAWLNPYTGFLGMNEQVIPINGTQTNHPHIHRINLAGNGVEVPSSFTEETGEHHKFYGADLDNLAGMRTYYGAGGNQHRRVYIDRQGVQTVLRDWQHRKKEDDGVLFTFADEDTFPEALVNGEVHTKLNYGQVPRIWFRFVD